MNDVLLLYEPDLELEIVYIFETGFFKMRCFNYPPRNQNVDCCKIFISGASEKGSKRLSRSIYLHISKKEKLRKRKYSKATA